MKIKPVILCGGAGTRLWPKSKNNLPKQFIDFGGWTLFQKTLLRIKNPMFDYPIISTNLFYLNLVRKHLSKYKIKKYKIILEPFKKNTAPAILSCALLKEVNYEQTMVFFPADHLIVGHKKFEKALRTANRLALKNSFIATIGVNPTYPSTAYGYIQYTKDGELKNNNAFHLKTFAEKPHLNLAKRFIKSGDFLWNSGIFIWRVDILLGLMKVHLPDLYNQLNKIKARFNNKENFEDLWATIEPESIDYGLMEKVASDAYVVKADFEWNDLGSWKALSKIMPKSSGDNVIRGNGMVLNGKENFIHSNDHFTAVVGLENVVVVQTDDATLVIHKEKVEEIKTLVEKLVDLDYKVLL